MNEKFRVKKGYGLVFHKDSRALRAFKDNEPTRSLRWPNGDDKNITFFVHDKASMSRFMFELMVMFREEPLAIQEIELGDHVIAFVYV